MMDNHEVWIAEMDRRKEVLEIKAQGKEARCVEIEAKRDALPPKYRFCSWPSCGNNIDTTTPKLKRANEKLWKKCPAKGCNIWACEDHKDAMNDHTDVCRKCIDSLISSLRA
jgi:hypothetical protein